MFSAIRNVFGLFWEGFIVLTIFFCAQDIYITMRKEAISKAAKGIPPIMKFNDKLWGRK